MKKMFSNTLATCLSFCIIISMLFTSVSVTATPLRPASSVTYITDKQGRALILHGLNTSNSSKYSAGMPWIQPIDVELEHDKLGTNAVRLLIFWSLLKPTKDGPFDDNYLSKVKDLVTWYGNNGMHVILDMHQDLYGPGAFADGPQDMDGAPVWATYTDGKLTKSVSPWGLMYLQPGEMRAWDNFWGTTFKHPELRVAYAAAWGHVAAYFANNDTVIGYDLMNEPFGGSLQSFLFEPTVLLATYQAVIKQIRLFDNDHWILVEPSSFPVTQGLPTTLPKPKDTRIGEPRIVYAPHLYPPTLTLDNGKASYIGINIPAVNAALASWTASSIAVANVWKAPIVIGELGAIDYKSAGNLNYVDKIMALTEDIGANWFWWSNDKGDTSPYLGHVGQEGIFNVLADHMAYPYAQAVAGTPEILHYDPAKKQLTVKFANKPGVTGTTDLFLSPSFFVNGYTVDTTDPKDTWKAAYNAKTHVLSITADPNSKEHTYTVTAL